MNYICVVLWIFGVLQISVCLEHIWHSYQFNPNHQIREELVITNITSDEEFKLEYPVTKWKSLPMTNTYYIAGLMEKNMVIASLEFNKDKNGFSQKSYVIELEEKAIEIVLFKHWNSTLRKSEAIVVVATQKPELCWYKIENDHYFLYWSWSLEKNVTHINIFQIEHSYHLIMISSFLSQISGDVYEFELKKNPNFWLRQKIHLLDPATTSTIINTGPDYFLAIPQPNLRSLLVYQLKNNHLVPYTNLTSDGINEVISFKTHHKSFVAFNGLNAGIYRFTKSGLVRESMGNSHLFGVNYWLPITYEGETILIAQRSLDHGLHKSSVIEIITYNGEKFEEHEDVHCFYFGEEILGLSCLPGTESEGGIFGSVSISLGNVLGLLIPRKNGFSELFMVKTEIRRFSNPVEKQLKEFLRQKEHLDKLMALQEKRYEEILAKSTQVVDFESLRLNLEKMEVDINLIKNEIDSFDKQEHYDKVVFSGPVKIEEAIFEEIKIDQIKEEPTNEILDNIVLKNKPKSISSKKVFKNLELENLQIEKINDIDAQELIFISSDNVTISGDLTLAENLVVLNDIAADKVNEEIFEEEVVFLDSPIDELIFENVEVLGDVSADRLINFPPPSTGLTSEIDLLDIPQNIEVVNVNGENFDEFLNQLYFKNLRNFIPGILKVEGDVFVKGDVKVDYLNNLKFPQEYVFEDNTFHNITGRKNFTKTLATSEVHCEGTVNDINPSNIITLTTNQNIKGVTTFKNLKVTESLDVDGEVLGEEANKFLPNPTLLEENFVKSNVHFKNLTVEGNIILSNNFNSENFQNLLSDIVYSTEDEAVIEAVKQFPEGLRVNDNLIIDSNFINDLNIESIVTKDTDQELNATTLNGIVDFDNVHVKGLYDFVDIKKLDEETVKLDGEQYISSTLIFEDDISANEVEVVDIINDMDQYQFQQTHDYETNEIDIDEVENITVEGDVVGNIDNFDIEDFDRRRLSISKNQIIEAAYNVSEVDTENMNIIRINDIDPYQFTYDSFMDKVKSKLYQGTLNVKNLYVNGQLEIEQINNQTTINMGGSLWKNDIKKYNLLNLTFFDDTYFSTLEIEKLSGVNFKKFLNNIVFKNESNPRIKGCKNFVEGISVENNIETKKLNNIRLSNILTRQGKQKISGPMTIHGKIYFDHNISIFENINNIPIKFITDNYQFDNEEFKIKGDILFNRLAHIENLNLKEYVDNKEVQQFLDNIVYKNGKFKLENRTIFENEALFEKNIRILGKINNVDLPPLVSDMVMITKDTEILSSVKFQEDVVVENNISADNLDTKTLSGIDLETWKKNAVFINKGFREGNYNFEEVKIVDNLHTEQINNIAMDTLIPLRTKQNLTELPFEEITTFKDIPVGNSTNFHHLPQEVSNTVTINSRQDIDSDLEFLGNVFIEGDLILSGLLNGMETDKIVTTNTEQDLHGIYNFKSKVILERNLIVHDLVNGINITNWVLEGVKMRSSTPDNVTDKWSIEDNLVFEDIAFGNGLINGIDILKFKEEIDEKRRYKYTVEKGFIDDYTNICKDLTYMHDKLKKQIYKFDYLENLQELDFKNDIHYIYHFTYKKKLYFLVNEEKSCKSNIFLFDTHFRFFTSINLGMISQIITVRNEDFMYFVINNEPLQFCEDQGTNLWQLTDDKFLHLVKVEDQDILQESLVPDTFYGLKGYTVTEFKVTEFEPKLKKYRRWQVQEDNMAFVPRGLSTGLALRTGRKLIRLLRDEPIEDFDYEAVIKGNFSEEFNNYLPGRMSGDLVVIKVGIRSSKRSLLAIASHEETSVKGSLDFIKIYEDVVSGKVFQKVSTYNPSSLVALDFNNGETMLVFLEDGSVLKVYEYKGIEGFKEKFSVKMEGSKLFTMSVTMFGKERKILGLINKNKINLIEAVMLGNKIEKNLQCVL